MTTQWADFPSGDEGLYNYDETKMLDGIWAQVTNCELIDDPDPNIGSLGRALLLGNNIGDGFARKVLTGTRDTVGMSARIWLGALPANDDRRPVPFAWNDAGNDTVGGLRINTTGALEVYGPSGVEYTTPGPVVTAGAWTHLSAKLTVSTGTFSVEREGIPIFEEVGLDFGADPVAQVLHVNDVSPSGFATYFAVKDSFIWDGLGTVNNDHPGPVTVYRLPVNADVSSGWTRTSGATDYGLLDESPPDDADYISAGFSPLPAPSIMGLDDLPPDVVAVRAAILVGRQRKSDGGDCQTQMSLSPNAGVDWYNGSDRAITTAFTYQFDVSELSPDTGNPWTPVEVNNATIKINRTV